MRIEAGARLRANPANKPNKPKDYTWVRKAEQDQKGKPRNSALDLPEGLFDKNPSEIANTLKTKSRDFQHALSRLTFYINRAGDNLDRQTQLRLEQAKDALYRAYGRQKEEK